MRRWLNAGGGLAGRFVSNAARQALGAVVFFATTVLLTRSLGLDGYATYFAGWNAAQLLVAAASFGLYNETIRRLAQGESFATVARLLALPYLLQAACLLPACYLWGRLTGADSVLLSLIAVSTTLGNLFSAIALGLDWFKTFAAGELLNNLAFAAAVFLIAPTEPKDVGYLFLGALIAKLLLYLITARRAAARPVSANKPEPARTRTVYANAVKSYGHALAQMATLRGLFLAAQFLLGPKEMSQLAVAWSFCDRALVLVQGVNQVLYPKLVRADVSARFRWWTNMLTSLVFVVAVVAMIALWVGLGRFGLAQAGPVTAIDFVLCLAFVPYVLRSLICTSALAASRFDSLFWSHGAALATLIATVSACLHFGVTDIWAAPAIVFAVSVAGLPSLMTLPPARIPLRQTVGRA